MGGGLGMARATGYRGRDSDSLQGRFDSEGSLSSLWQVWQRRLPIYLWMAASSEPPDAGTRHAARSDLAVPTAKFEAHGLGRPSPSPPLCRRRNHGNGLVVLAFLDAV